uniref:Putative E3 ubiquitin-protein ligase LIN n=1 Tax=Tanacetum cinerariifolium TaxID=118510 RepID=A0A6L2N7N2_TANCI|nr:putative E3 ubiquitin-protein ligase LIN [Tanacetum cinerariifolium]
MARWAVTGAFGATVAIAAGSSLIFKVNAEPRKICIYREEAIDTLVSCLKCSDTPATQIAASDAILALQGRFSSSGKPLVRTYLLKRAGFDKSYRSTMWRTHRRELEVRTRTTYVKVDVLNNEISKRNTSTNNISVKDLTRGLELSIF